MKLLILVAAAGLGSAALADPLLSPSIAADHDPGQPIALQADLAFDSVPTEEIFVKDDSPPLVTTTVDSHASARQIEAPPEPVGESDEFGVPEPSALETLSLGLAFFGLLLILYRMRTEKRRRRRRRRTKVRMRAIIAER